MKALSGTLVVTLEQAVAAPTCSRRLADAGARVIKLERPGGDFARGYDDIVHGQASYFVWLNRGKESVTCDLREPEDRALFEALVAQADVFIQNLKPGALDRLGFGTGELRKRHPKLITCSISGYGETGPYAHRKAYDLLIQAEAGLAGVTGTPETPSRIGVSIVDVGTGMTAYEAVLEALIARGRTGQGADIKLSMFDCMAELMAVPLLHGRYGKAPERIGLKHPSVAPYGVFQCACGTPILLSIQNDREWRTLAETVLGDPNLGDDPRFATNIARVTNRDATDAIVASAFANETAHALSERLAAVDLAFGHVNDVGGVLAHPCLREIDVSVPGGSARLPAPPAIVDGQSDQSFGPVPKAGAATEAVRREFLQLG